MPKAYILMNVESGSEDTVLQELKTVPEVEKAYFSYGVYDIIAKVKAETMDQLKEIISRKMRPLPGVKSTLTLISVEENKETSQ